ncbi:hypothetical protein STEG23_035632, partial [Scotinomys teguina]
LLCQNMLSKGNAAVGVSRKGCVLAGMHHTSLLGGTAVFLSVQFPIRTVKDFVMLSKVSLLRGVSFIWCKKQQSFECRRTAFQLTQKNRRFHLLLKLDAIISVNHEAANHRNLHYNTLSCHAP